jgi:hypothetical protein
MTGPALGTIRNYSHITMLLEFQQYLSESHYAVIWSSIYVQTFFTFHIVQFNSPSQFKLGRIKNKGTCISRTMNYLRTLFWRGDILTSWFRRLTVNQIHHLNTTSILGDSCYILWICHQERICDLHTLTKSLNR